MTRKQLVSSLLLLLAAIIWGVAFVAQSVGMEYVGPLTFSATRSFIGSVVLLPVIYLFRGKTKAAENPEEKQQRRRTLIVGGVVCGTLLAIATNLQQFGILYTSTGKSGFITACYIVIVPVLGLFLHKKVGSFVWMGVLIALVGMYFLCILSEGGNVETTLPPAYLQIGSLSVNLGDLLLILCSVAFSFQIMAVDHFSPLVSGVQLSCIQFLTCGVLSAIGMFLFEKPDIHSILQAWMPILYAGALSSGVAYTLQIVGQKNLNPTVASLIMSLESTISVLAGWLILGQQLSVYEIIGCILIFCALVLAQIPQKPRRRADTGKPK